MRISAKADYAVRVLLELASSPDGSLRKEQIAERQQIPARFLESIMTELRELGFVRAHRGDNAGYWLSHPPELISLAMILESIDGPLVMVHGSSSDETSYAGIAAPLRDAWVSAGNAFRGVLDHVSIAELVQRSTEPLERASAG